MHPPSRVTQDVHASEDLQFSVCLFQGRERVRSAERGEGDFYLPAPAYPGTTSTARLSANAGLVKEDISTSVLDYSQVPYSAHLT